MRWKGDYSKLEVTVQAAGNEASIAKEVCPDRLPSPPCAPSSRPPTPRAPAPPLLAQLPAPRGSRFQGLGFFGTALPLSPPPTQVEAAILETRKKLGTIRVVVGRGIVRGDVPLIGVRMRRIAADGSDGEALERQSMPRLRLDTEAEDIIPGRGPPDGLQTDLPG